MPQDDQGELQSVISEEEDDNIMSTGNGGQENDDDGINQSAIYQSSIKTARKLNLESAVEISSSEQRTNQQQLNIFCDTMIHGSTSNQ